MKIITTTAILIALAAPAVAVGSPSNNNGPTFGGDTTNNNTNLNSNSSTAVAGAVAGASATAAQQQGQAQGQQQGQNQSNTNVVQNSVGSSADNSITMEGSVGIAVGAAACTSGFSVGAPGAGAIGFNFSDKDCKIVTEAQVLWNMGLHDAARTHMTKIARVGNSVRATQPAPASRMSSMAEVRPQAQPASAFTSCTMTDGAIRVGVAAGADDATKALAASQCSASLGY